MNNTPIDEICLNNNKNLTKEKLRIVGNNVKKLRKKNGLTQSDVAFYIHSDKSLISALERGKSVNMTLSSLTKIATLFGVEVELLFSR